MVILGKQGWKFQTDNTSLVTHLFKAHYFPHCNILSSRLWANPCYVWRSIFSAKMVVKQGVWCRIGVIIPLWGSPWLKDGRSLAMKNPPYASLSHIKVQDIIEPSTKVWNTNLISNMFDHNTTHLILNTPLHHLVHEDKFILIAVKMVIILYVAHIVSVSLKLQIIPICIFRVSGIWFANSRYLPRFKILFGVCVGVVFLHVHACLVVVFTVLMFVLCVELIMKIAFMSY